MKPDFDGKPYVVFLLRLTCGLQGKVEESRVFVLPLLWVTRNLMNRDTFASHSRLAIISSAPVTSKAIFMFRMSFKMSLR